MIKAPMNSIEPSAKTSDLEATKCRKEEHSTRCTFSNSECESESKIDIFRRVSRVTPFDIASLAVSCVSVNNVNPGFSSVVNINDITDPEGGDCCRSLMELSRWINPSRSSKSDKLRRQHLSKRKAQRFDIAFLTRPATEEESSTGSGSRSDSQSPELDVVALDSSCKSEDDNDHRNVKSGRPLAVIRGSKRIKTGGANTPTRFYNQNNVEDLTYSKLRAETHRIESHHDRSANDHQERNDETVSAFKKVDRCSSSSSTQQQRIQKLTEDANLLTTHNQTRILLPNTSLVNGGLRPSSDVVLESNNKNIPYSDNSMLFKPRFQIPGSALLSMPNSAMDIGMAMPTFSKNDQNPTYSGAVTVARNTGSNLMQSNSADPNEATGSSGTSSNYVTKSYSHPLLPFLPPSLAALTFPSQNWCAKCNASFRMTSDLVYHMRSHHKKETDFQKKKREEKLRCDICHESFRERHHLTRHMTSHQ